MVPAESAVIHSVAGARCSHVPGCRLLALHHLPHPLPCTAAPHAVGYPHPVGAEHPPGTGGRHLGTVPWARVSAWPRWGHWWAAGRGCSTPGWVQTLGAAAKVCGGRPSLPHPPHPPTDDFCNLCRQWLHPRLPWQRAGCRQGACPWPGAFLLLHGWCGAQRSAPVPPCPAEPPGLPSPRSPPLAQVSASLCGDFAGASLGRDSWYSGPLQKGGCAGPLRGWGWECGWGWGCRVPGVGGGRGGCYARTRQSSVGLHPPSRHHRRTQ